MQVDVELANLLSRLLVEKADERLTAVQALSHPFLMAETPLHWMLQTGGAPLRPAAFPRVYGRASESPAIWGGLVSSNVWSHSVSLALRDDSVWWVCVTTHAFRRSAEHRHCIVRFQARHRRCLRNGELRIGWLMGQLRRVQWQPSDCGLKEPVQSISHSSPPQANNDPTAARWKPATTLT